MRGEYVPFYERAVTALRKAGFERQESQTQREFARTVSASTNGSISGNPASNGELGSLTHAITDYYYRVRFGQRPLDDQQRTEVNTLVRQLEQTLAQTR